jgi:hypothetical protein
MHLIAMPSMFGRSSGLKEPSSIQHRRWQVSGTAVCCRFVLDTQEADGANDHVMLFMYALGDSTSMVRVGSAMMNHHIPPDPLLHCNRLATAGIQPLHDRPGPAALQVSQFDTLCLISVQTPFMWLVAGMCLICRHVSSQLDLPV